MRLHTPPHYGDKVINTPSQTVNKHLLPAHPSNNTQTHTFHLVVQLHKYISRWQKLCMLIVFPVTQKELKLLPPQPFSKKHPIRSRIETPSSL